MDLSDFLLSLVSFEPNELEDIMSCFEKKKIKKNTMLIAEGEVCRELYFVESGMGRSYYLKEDGKEITQWFFGSGKFIDRKSTRLNSSHVRISYAVFCLKKK